MGLSLKVSFVGRSNAHALKKNFENSEKKWLLLVPFEENKQIVKLLGK